MSTKHGERYVSSGSHQPVLLSTKPRQKPTHSDHPAECSAGSGFSLTSYTAVRNAYIFQRRAGIAGWIRHFYETGASWQDSPDTYPRAATAPGSRRTKRKTQNRFTVNVADDDQLTSLITCVFFLLLDRFPLGNRFFANSLQKKPVLVHFYRLKPG